MIWPEIIYGSSTSRIPIQDNKIIIDRNVKNRNLLTG